MSDEVYLVEATLNGKPTHHLCDTEREALERAVFYPMIWKNGKWDSFDECPSSLRGQFESLFLKGRNADAIRVWNNFYCEPFVCIHEGKVVKNYCHHQPLEADDDSYFVVQIYEDDFPEDILCRNHDDALGYIGRVLARRNHRYKNSREIRRRVNRLLSQGKIAEAMDVWNYGETNPKFVIHQIRIVKTDCHRTRNAD